MKCSIQAALAAVCLLPIAAARAGPPADAAGIWTLQGENASVTTLRLTDRYYTDGLRVGWTSPTGAASGFLATLGQSLWGAGQQCIGFEVSHQIYTPAVTSTTIPDRHDRPYAGYLSANFSLISNTDTTRSLLALGLGVIGPAAGGDGLQNGFHDLIGQPGTHGWGAQVPNSAAIELLHERTWRLPLTQFAELETEVLPALTVGFGTVRDYVQAGVTIRLGQGAGIEFRRAATAPGTERRGRLRADAAFRVVHLRGHGRASGRLRHAATGATVPLRPTCQPDLGRGRVPGRLAMMAYGMRLTLAYVVQTQEFHGQAGGLHQFGSAAVSVRF